MIRKLSLPGLTLSAAALLTLTACSRHHQVLPQQAVPASTPAGQAAAGPAAPAAAAGGPVSSAQAADADSTSLEHLAAVPESTGCPRAVSGSPVSTTM